MEVRMEVGAGILAGVPIPVGAEAVLAATSVEEVSVEAALVADGDEQCF